MQNDKLLPCPFCGGEAKLYRNVAQTCFGAGCTNEKCAVNAPHLNFDTPEEAVEAWNTRKPMERILERLENELKLSDEEKKRCAKENPMQFDVAKGYATGISNALDIVRKGGVNNAE